MSQQQVRFKSKFMAALLALAGGLLGIQHWYLRRRYAWLLSAMALALLFTTWRAEVWWDSAAFWLLGLFFFAGAVEAVCLCLISDKRFDAVYNATTTRTNRSDLKTILLAIFAVLSGAIISLMWLAHVVFRVYHHMGWLDGLSY